MEIREHQKSAEFLWELGLFADSIVSPVTLGFSSGLNPDVLIRSL